jgi:hypothetical protein
MIAAEVDEMDDREFVERNSLLGSDGLQRIVDVRQVVKGNVANAGVDDFVFAHASVQPAEEERELDRDRQESCEQARERWLRDGEVVEWHVVYLVSIAGRKHDHGSTAGMRRTRATPVRKGG